MVYVEAFLFYRLCCILHINSVFVCEVPKYQFRVPDQLVENSSLCDRAECIIYIHTENDGVLFLQAYARMLLLATTVGNISNVYSKTCTETAKNGRALRRWRPYTRA